MREVLKRIIKTTSNSRLIIQSYIFCIDYSITFNFMFQYLIHIIKTCRFKMEQVFADFEGKSRIPAAINARHLAFLLAGSRRLHVTHAFSRPLVKIDSTTFQ